MTRNGELPAGGFGGWQDAEELRQWSFLRRSPQQRLDWLVEALTIAYQAGALRSAAHAPSAASSSSVQDGPVKCPAEESTADRLQAGPAPGAGR